MPGRGRVTVLDDLPQWIIVEEILIRLPPKDLLRCRAVHKCWHSATSSDKFILDHHSRQPLLPILSRAVGQQNRRLYVSCDTGAGQQQLCPVFRTSDYGMLQAALDGLLIVSHGLDFVICNPVTRKWAFLEKPQSRQGFHHHIDGFYRHQPSGEYRVLWGSSPTYYNAQDINYRTFYYVMAVGSANSRCIQQGCVPRPAVSSPSLELVLRDGLSSSSYYPPVHHRGNLHWKLGTHHGVDDGYIMVFDTAAETFRLMRRPDQLRFPRDLWLVKTDDTLALCSICSEKDTIDVWLLQNYDAETWVFKNQINLSGMDPLPPIDPKVTMFPRMAVLNDGELLTQFNPRRVLRYGMAGMFLGCVKNGEHQEIKLWITNHYLRESVIPLPPFHEIREDGAIQEPPFFVWL